MDYVLEYKRFINSHYLNGAIRITAGITLPAILLGYFHNLSTGIVVSIGAMCVANTDNPGPIHHRRNGMIACVLFIFFVSLITGLVNHSPVWMGLIVLVFCFVFSLMSIYGNRAGSIGLNSLLVMVLNIDFHRHGSDVLYNALYIAAGGLWYTVLSLFLYSFRPYKLVQQALGDSVQATAGYLRIKASFYSRHVDYDKSYRQLLESQVAIQEKQDLLRELIFKSRKIVKESTHTGRILMMIFLDSIDLFECIMTAQQDYRLLHRLFDNSQFLEECRTLILDLASELDEIGLAIMSGKPSLDRSSLSVRIRQLRAMIAATHMDGVADLSNILDSIEDINNRLHALHQFTTYDRKLSRNFPTDLNYEQAVAGQSMDRELVLDNLTLQSNYFRHALRVSIATIAGYIISRFLPLGHGYWILLTIIVILKPMYSLTKKRNFERLMGTLGGALVGFLLILFIPDRTVLFVLMILFMMGTYVFLRRNYLVCVTLMTPYILLLFHLLYPVNFKSIAGDRVVDTLIGSVISFLASIFIIPSWEHQRIIDSMIAAVKTNIAYFRNVAGAFAGRSVTVQEYKLSRKHAFVALANLSDAFSRMLQEPRRQRKKIEQTHQFVVASQMLTSYIATLAYYEKPLASKYADPSYRPVVDGIAACLDEAALILENGGVSGKLSLPPGKDGPEMAKPIADQFGFIGKVAGDILRLSPVLHEALT
ncbi:MAG TPA: FUSC family membrane protein [Puia sp.]|nr:FUSC family membrane protein [Puia sp.]